MGIEFAYAAETAFVSPTLLKIGKDDEVSFIFKLKTSFPDEAFCSYGDSRLES